MSDKKEYLTLKEAALVARMSYTKVRLLIKAGELRALRPAWKLLIDRADLDAFMQKTEVAGKAG